MMRRPLDDTGKGDSPGMTRTCLQGARTTTDDRQSVHSQGHHKNSRRNNYGGSARGSSVGQHTRAASTTEYTHSPVRHSLAASLQGPRLLSFTHTVALLLVEKSPALMGSDRTVYGMSSWVPRWKLVGTRAPLTVVVRKVLMVAHLGSGGWAPHAEGAADSSRKR